MDGDAPIEEWRAFLGISQSTFWAFWVGLLSSLSLLEKSEELVGEAVRGFFLWRGEPLA